MAKDKDYEVGYRKPPKKTRFKKGQSGNPSGKPKKKLTDEEMLVQDLSSKVTVTEGGKQRRITKYEAIVKRQVHLAMNGDPRAVKFVTQAYKEAIVILNPVPEEVMSFTLKLEDDEEQPPDWEYDDRTPP